MNWSSGRRGGHHYGARSSAAAAGAAGALPGGGDGAGVSGHDAGVERADVDAEFERVGGDDAANAAVAQTAFDFAPFARQIAAAIAANRLGLAGLRAIGLLQISEQKLGVQAAIGEDDGLQLAREEFFGHARGFVHIAAADAEIAIDHRRIVKDEEFFGGGRAIFFDDLDLVFDQLRGEFAGIGDRRGAADELRLRAIEFGDAAQAPQNVGQMAAEDAAVGVQFVQDDVAQIFEEARPFGVVRQDAGVQHVWIREDDVAAFADGFAGVAGRVAIVGEDAEANRRGASPDRAVRLVGLAREPWWGRGRARACRYFRAWRSGSASCSRASCRRPWE